MLMKAELMIPVGMAIMAMPIRLMCCSIAVPTE